VDRGELVRGAFAEPEVERFDIDAGATGDRGDDNDLFVVRIRPDGEVDAGFGTDGIVYIDFGGDEAGGSIAIDDQGRILVAGSSRVGDPISGDRYGVVARLMP
jgi:hypothetical protein